ncbi:MAG: hypothetical protein U1F35_08725 [Steroidobacteraceae bacterium]
MLKITQFTFGAIGLVSMLAGCFLGVSKIRYSEPFVDSSSVRLKHVSGVPVDKMILSPNLSFYVNPANEKVGKNVIILPIPFADGVDPRVSSVFIVGVGMYPNLPSHRLNVGQIFLSIGNSESITAKRVYGPWNCKAKKVVSAWRVLPVDPIDLPQDECTSIALEFAMPPPDPDVEFSIRIEGATRSINSIDLPRVRFRGRTRWDPTGAP